MTVTSEWPPMQLALWPAWRHTKWGMRPPIYGMVLGEMLMNSLFLIILNIIYIFEICLLDLDGFINIINQLDSGKDHLNSLMYSLEDMDPDGLEPHMEGLPLGLQLLESLLQSISSGDGSKPFMWFSHHNKPSPCMGAIKSIPKWYMYI